MPKFPRRGLSSTRGTHVTRVGIVGTSGRNGDKRLTKLLFHKMVCACKAILLHYLHCDLSDVLLVSGGAAWADHVPVALFLSEDIGSLTLHLPDSLPAVVGVPCRPGASQSAVVGARLHAQFASQLGEKSVLQLEMAMAIGARVCVHDGFHARNKAIAADSDVLVGFTFGSDGPPARSGTLFTWNRLRVDARKLHVSLTHLLDVPLDDVPLTMDDWLVDCSAERKTSAEGILQFCTKATEDTRIGIQ